MIPVQLQPEAADFDAQVRRPGLAYLQTNPNPSSREFKRRNYWTRAVSELSSAYENRCAYTSLRMVDSISIDHFLPKAHYPELAYEWSNYRLARQKLNGRKGNTEEVIDPFNVEFGWFELDLPSCLLQPAQSLEREIKSRINQTINILQLNRDESLVQERCDLLVNLADELITIEFVDKTYPFLSYEVRRQGVERDLKRIFARN
jgi:hypothetical protein